MKFKSFLSLLLCAFPLFALDKVSVQLKWHHQFQFAGYYAAVEQGYYREEGLDVTLKDRDPAINNIEQVLNGESQYGIADSALLVYRARKKPIVIVAPIFQHSPGVFLALKSSGIDSPSKMIGKRISLYPNDVDGLPLLAMLHETRVTKKGFTRLETHFDINELTSKKVDVIHGYATNEPFLFREKGFEVNIIYPQNFGVDLYGDMLFTTQDELKNHPKRVEAMKRATIKGWEYAIAHKEEMIRLIQTKYGNTQTTDKLLFEANGVIAAIASESVTIGTFDQGRLDYMREMLGRHGLLNPDESLGKTLYRNARGIRQKTLERISLDSIVYLTGLAFVLLIVLIYFIRKLQTNKKELKALNIQIQSDKQRYKALMENVPGVIYTYQAFADGRSCFPYASEQIYDIYGVSPQEVLEDASKVFDLLDPEDIDHVARTITYSHESLTIWKAQYRINHPQKGLIWVQGVAKPEKQSDGSLLWYGYIYDITENKNASIALQQSETKYKSLIENTPGIAYRCKFDKDWTMLFMSKAVDTITGYECDAFIGNKEISYGMLILPEDTKYAEQAVAQAIEKNELWEIEYRIRHKDGTIRYVYEKGRAALDKNGNVEYLDGFLLDVTEKKQMADTLLESNQRFQILFDSSPDPTWIIDNNVFLECNQAALNTLGYPNKESLINIHPSEISPEFQPDGKVSYSKAEKMMLLAKEKGVYRFEWVYKRLDQSDFFAEVTLSAIMLQGKKVLACTSRDISERKKAEAALHSALSIQKAIFENAGSAIITTDIEGLITSYNKAAEVMFGYSSEEMVDKQSPAILFKPEEIIQRAQEFSQELGKVVEPGFKVVTIKADYNLKNIHEWTYVLKDGSEIPAVLNVTAMRNINGDIFGYLGISTDMTLFKEAEAKTIQAKEAAEASVRAKSEFLAAMSHEIRTPMNGVLGMLELLDKTQLDSSQKHKVAIATSSATSLLGLINDILDFSKIEAGKMDLEMLEFDLKQELVDFAESIAFKAEEKGLKLILNMDEITHSSIISDPGRLRQILTNLIGNAVKFTHEGQITINTSLDKENETHGRLHIDVVDTGIGIPPEKIETLFEAFTQADGSTTRKYGGTGLGLSIVKKLCELMNGNISAKSTPGAGSTFSIDLRVELGSDQITLQAVETPTNEENIVWPSNTRILLVEDNFINQLVAEGILEQIGLGCDMAANGLEALEAIRASNDTQPYTLVLMDCQMPEMDGYDATRAIRKGEAGEENKQLPIIAMTANAMQGDREKCTLAGMDDYIAKPINFSVLKAALMKWLLNNKTCESSNNERSAAQQIRPSNEIVIDGVDITHLEKHYKPDKIASFLKTFANTERHTCEKLQKVEIFSDEFKAIIHTLKGVSGNLSIFKVYELTINIEQSKNQEAVSKMLLQLCQEMQLTINSIDYQFN